VCIAVAAPVPDERPDRIGRDASGFPPAVRGEQDASRHDLYRGLPQGDHPQSGKGAGLRKPVRAA
jgi:hypothetical protein